MANNVTKQWGDPPHSEINVPIDQGSNLKSAELKLNGAYVYRIYTPVGWNAATLSFLERSENVATPVSPNDGTADYTIATVASKEYIIPASKLLGGPGYITFVSSVAQAGLALTVVTRTIP